MLHVYLDYPTSHMGIHRNPECSDIYKANKAEYRISKITLPTLSTELAKFANKEYRFASDGQYDDIWLEIDLGDETFELSVAHYVQKLIGHYYKPLRNPESILHC